MSKECMIPVVEGGKVVASKRMPFQIVTDERFCDGFYFVSALKVLKDLYSNPSQLKEPLKTLPVEV
jgi:pyruvate/2-oxoglutarate dehydrogenase complex dihydrolipoamide acyltransferase (E2) component